MADPWDKLPDEPTDAQRASVAARVAGGESKTRLAAEFGVSRSTIDRAVVIAGRSA